MSSNPRFAILKRLRGSILLAALIGGCFLSEYASHRLVNPNGHVSTLRDYLAWRPAAQQFTAVEMNGTQHVIAYGAFDSWLCMSSGPSAYVFDGSGRLVDWSSDIGDDSQFDQQWAAQGARGRGLRLDRGQVQQLAATQPTR